VPGWAAQRAQKWRLNRLSSGFRFGSGYKLSPKARRGGLSLHLRSQF